MLEFRVGFTGVYVRELQIQIVFWISGLGSELWGMTHLAYLSRSALRARRDTDGTKAAVFVFQLFQFFVWELTQVKTRSLMLGLWSKLSLPFKVRRRQGFEPKSHGCPENGSIARMSGERGLNLKPCTPFRMVEAKP